MTSNRYHVQGNPVIPVPTIGNLPSDLAQIVITKFNEAFRGNERIEYTYEYTSGNPILFSNIPRALGMNQIALQETNGRIGVISPIQVVRYWDAIPERNSTYADTNAVSLFPNEGPNEDLRQRALQILGITTKLEVPLLALGLGVKKADNDYGFTFTETHYQEAIEAPFLRKDQKVIYDPKTKTLVPTEYDRERVYSLTPIDQSGLRMAVRDWNVSLNFNNGDVLGSNACGRVQFFEGP